MEKVIAIGEKREKVIKFGNFEYKVEIERLEENVRYQFDGRLYLMNGKNKRGRKYRLSVTLINNNNFEFHKYEYVWDGELIDMCEEMIEQAEAHSESICFSDDITFLNSFNL